MVHFIHSLWHCLVKPKYRITLWVSFIELSKAFNFFLEFHWKNWIFSGRKAVSNNFWNVMTMTLVPPNYIALLFLTFVDIFDYFDLITIHFPVLETVQILVRSSFNNRYVILGNEMEIENRYSEPRWKFKKSFWALKDNSLINRESSITFLNESLFPLTNFKQRWLSK